MKSLDLRSGTLIPSDCLRLHKYMIYNISRRWHLLKHCSVSVHWTYKCSSYHPTEKRSHNGTMNSLTAVHKYNPTKSKLLIQLCIMWTVLQDWGWTRQSTAGIFSCMASKSILKTRWVNGDYFFQPNEEFFSNIMARTSCFFISCLKRCVFDSSLTN